jgi:hypothetical protein
MSHTGTTRRWILGEPQVRGVAGGRLISRVGGEQQVEDEDWPVLLVHQLEVQVVGLVQTQAEVLPDESSCFDVGQCSIVGAGLPHLGHGYGPSLVP